MGAGKKITHNTVFLYVRQIINLLVSFYTIRIVLRVLGTEDYGIYNVIAGIVAMTGFLNSSMANASQRYFSFELGKHNINRLSEIFSMTIVSYVGISIFLIVISETIGTWYIQNKLVLPLGRESAVSMSFQWVIVTFIFSLIASPFMALIIAYEDMFVFSLISILESLTKLIMSVLLSKLHFDKLVLYSFLMIFPSFISFLVFSCFCFTKYKNIKFKKYWNWKQIKEMYVYTISNLGGSVINIFKNQVLNIFINQRFNSKIVAGRGIATNISGIIQSFSVNFSTAISPFVTKKFAQGDRKELFDFFAFSCKISYFINFVIGLPVVLEIDCLLKLWLKTQPEYSSIFSQLIIIDCCIDSLTLPLMVGIQATGKISKYVFSMSVFNILYLPVCLIMFHFGFNATSALLVAPFFTFVSIFIRIYYICKNMDYKFINMAFEILVPVVAVTVFSSSIMYLIVRNIEKSFLRLCLTVVVSFALNIFFIVLLGLNKAERSLVYSKIKARLRMG